MLLSPHGSGPQRFQYSATNAGSDGVTVTASATANTMGSWVELIASTSFDSTKVFVMLLDSFSTAVNSNILVDIGVGAAGSEAVVIPTLLGGGAAPLNSGMGVQYMFKLAVPAGSRIAARAQAATASRTVLVNLGIQGGPKIPGEWVGSRVTAYGINAASSTGTAVTPGSTPSWGSATQLSSSTANNIKQLQMGVDFGGDLTGSGRRYLTRIGVGASPGWIVEGIPFTENANEQMYPHAANWLLSQMDLSIPAGSDLRIAVMGQGTEARNMALYGVD